MANDDHLVSLAQDLLNRSQGSGGAAVDAYRQAVLRVSHSLADGSEVTTPRLRRQIRELHFLTLGVAASLEVISSSLPSGDEEVSGLTSEIGRLFKRLTCAAECRKHWDECFEGIRESTNSGGDPGDPIPATPEALDGVVACDLAFALCLLECGLFVW